MRRIEAAITFQVKSAPIQLADGIRVLNFPKFAPCITEMQIRLHPLLFLSCALLIAPATHAQMIEGTVRTEYAEVLRVEPVYLPVPPPDDEAVQCASMLPLDPMQTADSGTDIPPAETDCIPLQSARTQTGPLVLYDVDYVLRGVKYRSRLPYDPGNRVQVQLSVTPLLPAEKQPPPPSGEDSQ